MSFLLTSLSRPALVVVATMLFASGSFASTPVWIKLTGPSGRAVFINITHIVSIKSDTDVPGAKSQIDLANGKFQGVQESVDRVMELISATSRQAERERPPDG